jgi:hypothetical protein
MNANIAPSTSTERNAISLIRTMISDVLNRACLCLGPCPDGPLPSAQSFQRPNLACSLPNLPTRYLWLESRSVATP